MTSRGSNLRWTVAVVFSLLAGAILIGIRRSGQDVDAAERAYDVAVLNNIADSVGPVVQDLNKIGKGNKKAVRSERQRLKREGKRGKELPKIKFATSTETVWNYLYQNLDKDLIKYSTSEDELAKKVARGDENFNAITAMIQKIEAEDASIWLAQLAYWMKTVAIHWPKGIRIRSQRAVSKLEDLLRVDFAFDEKLKAEDIEKMIKNNDTILESHVDASEMAPEEIKAVEDAKRVVGGLLNRHKITGGVAIKMLNETIHRDDVSIHTWHTTLSFLLGIAEAAPLFEEYLEACQSSTFFSSSKNLYDSDPTSNRAMTNEAVELLTMLESGCEDYPRINKLVRAIFFNILKNSHDDRTKRVFDDSRR